MRAAQLFCVRNNSKSRVGMRRLKMSRCVVCESGATLCIVAHVFFDLVRRLELILFYLCLVMFSRLLRSFSYPDVDVTRHLIESKLERMNGSEKLQQRCVIVGGGPAGMMAVIACSSRRACDRSGKARRFRQNSRRHDSSFNLGTHV